MHTTETQSHPADRLHTAYRSMPIETDHDDLPVQGHLPQWLTGTLLRNSVANFEYGDRRVNHLFDGLAMIHKFSFADGKVNYANRFLDTQARRSEATGELTLSEFGTEPCRSRFKRFTHMFKPSFTDNANVNVVRLGEKFIALSETPLPIEFDPETLKTLGVSDALPPGPGITSHTTAHPHLDRNTKAMVSYLVRFGRKSQYEIHETAPAGDRLAAKMPVSRPSYMHSFSLTERYAVIQENPLRVNPLSLATSGKPFIENYEWDGSAPSIFHAFDRSSGECVGSWETEAFFCFHHVNAFERDGEIVVDLVAHEDSGIVEQLYLDAMDSTEFSVRPTKLRRFRLRPDGTVGEESLTDEIDSHFELPRINYGANNMRPYRYAYGTGFVPANRDAPDPELSKVDIETGAATSWGEANCVPGEPVFVASPEAKTEDDGVVLSTIIDTANDSSFLLVLDAQTFEERARATTPHRIPLSFHGSFFK